MRKIINYIKFNKLKSKHIPWIILIIQFLWIIITFYNKGRMLIDSDMASEMILANFLNEEGAFLITKNWFYSTELRVINSHLVYQLALAIFKNWHIARTFSMAILLSMLLGSYFFMARKAKLNNSGIWGAILLLTPFSSVYSWIVLIGNFYIINISIGFLCLGILFYLYHSKSVIKKIIYVIILICLSIIAGLSGIRMTVIFYLPLIASAILMLFIELSKTKQQDLSIKFIKSPISILAGATILAFVSNFAGYLINSTILQQSYHYLSYNVIKLHELELSEALSVFGQINTLFGYKTGMSPVTIDGIKSLISMLCFIACIASFILLIKKWKALSKCKQILLAFSTILLLSNVIINQIANQTFINYLVPAFVYCLIIISIALSEISHKNTLTKALTFIIAAIIIFTFYYKPNINHHYSDSSDAQIKAANWLVENDYKTGYATYWNSNVITEFSNGQLEMITILCDECSNNFETLEVREWLQKKDHLRKAPEGTVFILLSEYENSCKPAFAIKENLVYSDCGYFIYEYKSYEELFLLSQNN